MKTFLVAVTVSLLAGASSLGARAQLSLVPAPSTVQAGTGELAISQSFSVAVTGFHDGSLDRGIRRFQDQLSRETGVPFHRQPGGQATLTIHADHARERTQTVDENESYDLSVAGTGATLTAPSPLGILHGLQTILQLVQVTERGFAIPALTIKDSPRFRWRGLLIDVSRHFMPLEVLKRNLDGMAAVKMNVLHWHLADDQGFRVESKKFPKLQEMGSDGQYYTQEEIRDFVAYAYDRGIRVIPEFDVPGHSRSWLVGYPELGSAPGPYKLEPGEPDTVMDPTREETYKFLDKFIEEMAKIFPDAYFHIGGDEVNGKVWDANPKIQAFIHDHGMKDDHDLQAYFNRRLEKIVRKHHKIMMGWDEVLHPDLPKTIVVQSWRGQESLAVAAKQGYRGLLSHGYYLDLMWPAEQHYAVDPTSGAAATLTAEEKDRILGGEACMWTEWVSPEILDSRLWPRTAAIAERLWSRQDVTDAGAMYARLDRLSWRLEWLGLTHRSNQTRMLQRTADTDNIGSLRTLADVVEPVKDYERPDHLVGVWDYRAPLNHLIDAIPPESEAARHFRGLVGLYAQSGFKDATVEARIRVQLARWRDNDSLLHSVLERSFLLQEDIPLSEDLSALGAAGLQALEYLDQAQPSPESWRSQQLARIEKAKSAKANLLLMVAAPVQQLVEASAGALH